jgi:hypothetical protein
LMIQVPPLTLSTEPGATLTCETPVSTIEGPLS